MIVEYLDHKSCSCLKEHEKIVENFSWFLSSCQVLLGVGLSTETVCFTLENDVDMCICMEIICNTIEKFIFFNAKVKCYIDLIHVKRCILCSISLLEAV